MRSLCVSSIAIVALAAACADHVDSPAPEEPLQIPAVLAGSPSAQPGDTGIAIIYASRVRVSGRVLSGATPVAGARVTLYRNVLVDGRGVSLHVADQTTGADGAFAFVDVVGGPYVLAHDVTADHTYGDAVAYALGTTAEVHVDLQLGARTGTSADSTRGG